MEDYRGMIIKLSRRAQSALRNAGIEADIDDIIQEAQITFIRASELFDPDRKVKFSTYLWNAISTNLNRYCDVQRDANRASESLTAPFGDDGGTLLDVLEDPNAADPVRSFERMQHAAKALSGFDVITRDVLISLIYPSNAILAEVSRMQFFSKMCKEKGHVAPTVKLSVDSVCKIKGLSQEQTAKIRREVREFMACQ